MNFGRSLRCVGVALVALLWSTPGWAVEPEQQLNITTHWVALVALALFIVAYLLVVLEEYTELSKSKPVVFAAGLIWTLIAGYVAFTPTVAPVDQALRHTLEEFTQLFLFLLVAMTYVNAMNNRNVFEVLRAWLARREFSYRQMFWITGCLAFVISPLIDNLTTSLVLSAVILAVGRGSPRFVATGCVNIVVAANAGGAFSPFGDITTLMVWQSGKLQFLDFFQLLLPAIVNFVVPAFVMQFALPRGAPEPNIEEAHLRRGARRTMVLFGLTILTAVLVHNYLELPPYLGMMLGLAYLQLLMFYLLKTTLRKDRALQRYRESDSVPPPALIEHERDRESPGEFNIFSHIAAAEWDTLLFFYGVMFCVGGLAFLGYLSVVTDLLYIQWGATAANTVVGLLSAIVDNIPIMAAVIQMNPAMGDGQWLLATLTAGVGGSIFSIGSAAGVALMGQARGIYTFASHLKWSPIIMLGYITSIAVHFWINGAMFGS